MGVAVQLLGTKPPDAREAGVAQLEAPVAAEHGNAFIEIVQRCALDRNLRVERTFQGQGVGDVLEGEQQPAERCGAATRRTDEPSG